ncbi:ATP-dependent RNA helicase DEAH11, chloroplastic-like [Olea europaea subsp. europaea]|uniref:ATP-dependent RNA helicase DEAH11, chloroplastic-like n=1 Tax=Olea europaea subsp. europaea TaxID=158383 RepID=A0A8S0VJG4_OLEEU|nr:ATP-dependent RNA helicase DEAH11, chloroplastic-like [Olea europaea subsp. europaea]
MGEETGNAGVEIKNIEDKLKKEEGRIGGRERDLISKRVEELNSGLRCIVDYLENEEKTEVVVEMFHLVGEIDWGKIYSLLTREYRRLD